jgi:hypothetical protein
MSRFGVSGRPIERLISMTAGSESAEIYIYIQAVIPQLVNNEVITLSAADVNSLKRSWSPRVEREKKRRKRGERGKREKGERKEREKKEDLRASANPPEHGIATERRRGKKYKFLRLSDLTC